MEPENTKDPAQHAKPPTGLVHRFAPLLGPFFSGVLFITGIQHMNSHNTSRALLNFAIGTFLLITGIVRQAILTKPSK